MSALLSPPDQLQREQAVEPTRSVLLSAPAGSGKTGVLLLRYLRCLLCVERPEHVVAITFTNKAAGEIKERVMGALQSAESMPINSVFDRDIREAVLAVREHQARLNWNLLENSARLRIATFDSFCGSLVRRLPLLCPVSWLPLLIRSRPLPCLSRAPSRVRAKTIAATASRAKRAGLFRPYAKATGASGSPWSQRE